MCNRRACNKPVSYNILRSFSTKKRAAKRLCEKSNGAAYRIRTYDVLIRSQTLYPAEVTPRCVLLV